MDLHTHDHICSKAFIPTRLCNTIDLAASKSLDFFHQLTQSIIILPIEFSDLAAFSQIRQFH